MLKLEILLLISKYKNTLFKGKVPSLTGAALREGTFAGWGPPLPALQVNELVVEYQQNGPLENSWPRHQQN